MPEQSKPLAIVSGLDGLPLVSVPVVPLPNGHPDRDPYCADMREIARLGRQLWIEAVWWRRNGDPDAPKPEVTDDELHVYYSTPHASSSALLTLALDDFADIDVASIGRVA